MALSGSKHPNAKLTERDVRKIKKMRSKKVTQRECAEHFDVSISVIQAIEYGITWRHVK